jgi:hypothetical protein
MALVKRYTDTVPRQPYWVEDGDVVAAINANSTDFRLPAFDKIEFTYVDAGAADDDRIETAVYTQADVVVATLTYAYVGSTNNIASVTQT